ncbi:helix-turn-helix transcriptional regulator [Pseudonocardia sp. H11422]|uniref:helix-turn-helix transcriptional regulator n=1 Tax=Pseudonocardia sp. H11422 TaxID=2835866 RepID=UPI002027E91C|nr:LuxR C-terminal-related transcriptional regulator [Pseudonocardia sp. H11422]
MARLLDVDFPARLAGGDAGPPRPCGREIVRELPTGTSDVVGRVRRALVMLRDPGSTTDLVRRIPAAVATLGFDRVVYARLSRTRWEPAAVFGRPPEEAPGVEALTAERCPAEHLVLEQLSPVVVDATRADRLLPLSWCPSYIVTPIVDRGVVVGLLHAGNLDPARTPAALDTEILWTFAEALVSCLAAARAVDALRDLVTRMTEVAGGFGGTDGGPAARLPEAAASMTAREREVLELMAAGQTNGQIARRLVITEGTVKSHVKRIMRKLHAANRAEAVAAWIRPVERAPVVERL